MKVLVGDKHVVGDNVRIQVKSDRSVVVNLSANPFDEIAPEEALRLCDKDIAIEVVVAAPDPPILEIADIALVGDLFKVLPDLEVALG